MLKRTKFGAAFSAAREAAGVSIDALAERVVRADATTDLGARAAFTPHHLRHERDGVVPVAVRLTCARSQLGAWDVAGDVRYIDGALAWPPPALVAYALGLAPDAAAALLALVNEDPAVVIARYGAMVRAERERRGWSVEDLACRIHAVNFPPRHDDPPPTEQDRDDTYEDIALNTRDLSEIEAGADAYCYVGRRFTGPDDIAAALELDAAATDRLHGLARMLPDEFEEDLYGHPEAWPAVRAVLAAHGRTP